MDFLKEHKDVFAWFHEDMPGINPSVIIHRLNVDPPHMPVIQKHHRFNPERYTTIIKEVDKLLKAKFIREAHYPEWLANVIMVKQPNEKWRICIDYRDLNKACPKDSFPLPRIDQLVDAPLDMTYSASSMHILGTTRYACALRMRTKRRSPQTVTYTAIRSCRST